MKYLNRQEGGRKCHSENRLKPRHLSTITQKYKRPTNGPQSKGNFLFKGYLLQLTFAEKKKKKKN